jgi:hypothetical protein
MLVREHALRLLGRAVAVSKIGCGCSASSLLADLLLNHSEQVDGNRGGHFKVLSELLAFERY